MDELVDDLEEVGEDLRRLDPAGIIRHGERRLPEKLGKPAGYGNTYLVSPSFDEFLTVCIAS
jgi:hypothetical protein